MRGMFYECKKFSENLDSWTTKLDNIEETTGIFEGCDKFDKERFLRKMYHEAFETEDELYKLFKYDYIINLINTYNKHKNIENLTICHALYLYNHIYDNYINGLLRNDNELKRKLNQKLLDFFKKIIHTIDDYFTGQSSPRSTKGMKLYRGEKKLCEGDFCRTGVINSYSSTSKDPYISFSFTNRENCCFYTYELEEGIPYIDVNELMKKDNQQVNCETKLKLKNDEEFEVILPRGIILNKIREETKLKKRMRNFIISVSYDDNYTKNNPINF